MRIAIGLALFSLMMIQNAFAATTRIMPLGDSLTAGGYNEDGQYKIGSGYRVKLDELLREAGLDFVFVGSLHDGPAGFQNNAHEGHSGWRIDQIEADVSAWLRSAQPDVILLMIGTNDVVQNHDMLHAPERFAELLARIEATSPAATILVASVIPTENENWNATIQTYNDAIEQIVGAEAEAGHPAAFVDMYDDAGLHHDRTDLIDGVHPSPRAYEKLSPVWADAIMRLSSAQARLKPR